MFERLWKVESNKKLARHTGEFSVGAVEIWGPGRAMNHLYSFGFTDYQGPNRVRVHVHVHQGHFLEV